MTKFWACAQLKVLTDLEDIVLEDIQDANVLQDTVVVLRREASSPACTIIGIELDRGRRIGEE